MSAAAGSGPAAIRQAKNANCVSITSAKDRLKIAF
jgi:hypothetical protein